MKKRITLAIAVAFAISTNAQTILGTHSNDSVLLRANSGPSLTSNNRIKLRAEGQVTFHDVNPFYIYAGATETASVAMKMRGGDKTTLLITDNPGVWIKRAQLAIVNENIAENGIHVVSKKTVSDIRVPTGYGIAELGGNGGYFRENSGDASSTTYRGYRCQNTISGSSTNVNFISFASGGNISTSCESLIDYYVEDLGYNGVCSTRYGMKIDFDNIGSVSHPSGAWGVYQTSNSIRNHFNGATLFGSTTDNTFDKAQVTGGTKTDGLAAGIRNITADDALVNTDYTAFVANSATATITLPTSGVDAGKIFVIKKTNAISASVYVDPSGAATVDGNANYELAAQYSSVTVQFDGSNYHVIAEVIRP